jgi:hypothetical protein
MAWELRATAAPVEGFLGKLAQPFAQARNYFQPIGPATNLSQFTRQMTFWAGGTTAAASLSDPLATAFYPFTHVPSRGLIDNYVGDALGSGVSPRLPWTSALTHRDETKRLFNEPNMFGGQQFQPPEQPALTQSAPRQAEIEKLDLSGDQPHKVPEAAPTAVAAPPVPEVKPVVKAAEPAAAAADAPKPKAKAKIAPLDLKGPDAVAPPAAPKAQTPPAAASNDLS